MTVRIMYFVHGTTTDNEQHISSGWNNVPLSALGRQQSVDLRAQTAHLAFDVVYCSDLIRAQDSAKLAWENIYKIISDSRLRECNYGQLNGASSDIVEPLQEGEMWHKPFPDGESYDDVKNRIADFLAHLKKHHTGQHVALVGHKAPQLALDVLIKGWSWQEALAKDWRKTKAWQPGWGYTLS